MPQIRHIRATGEESNLDCFTIVAWRHEDFQWGMSHGLPLADIKPL